MSDNSRQGDSVRPNGRPTRATTRAHAANGWADRNGDSMGDDEENAPSEPDYGDDEGDDEHIPDDSNDDEDDYDDEELLDEDLDVQGDKSLVVKLAVPSSKLQGLSSAGLPSPVNESQDASMPRDVDMTDASVGLKATAGSAVPKQLTPEPTIKTDSEENGSRTPAAGMAATSLAFRGSPEKPLAVPEHAPIAEQ